MERVHYGDRFGGWPFIKALNPNTDNLIEYNTSTIKYGTLLNNAVYIAAQVVNKSLNKHIFDYEDIFKQDFFEEYEKNCISDEEYENGVLDFDSNDPTKFKDIDTAQDETLNILHDIQDYLKKYCIDVIHKNKDIIKDIPVQQIYTLYNNGQCLPDKYKNIKEKIYKAIDYPANFHSIKNSMNNAVKCFKLSLMNAYIKKSSAALIGKYEISSSAKEYKNKYMKLYKDYDVSLYNPVDFLLDNLDLMAEHLVGYCYKEINQINLVRKANSAPTPIPISEIESLQTVKLLSSEFDYTALLGKYDIKAIDGSIIKYYQAVQQWTDELMDKLDYYEKEKEAVIRDFNIISLQLSKKYEHNPNLTDEENELLEQRQRYFQKKFSLGMNEIKSKILSVKKQANDIEYRIDKINNGDSAITELAKLEKEDRASFSFIAENTAKIIHNALLKIEYFETHHQFVMNAISIWANWTENYRVFKTTYKEDLKNSCAEDSIEEEIWTKWYADWQKLRYNIELTIQPLIERGLKNEFAVENKEELTVPEQIIAELEVYKNTIDKFFLEERKGIYQKFAFQTGGDLQDKFETESSLYKYTYKFQAALQEIIFNCTKAEDRIYILNWASSLLDIQIDEILTFVADNDLQEISKTILEEFAKLKQKNYDVYLTDVEAYSKEMAEREKQYNSLIFKMRKDLNKDNKEVKA